MKVSEKRQGIVVEKNEKKENSIELLRIICMIWIIFGHICGAISMNFIMGKAVSFNYFFDLFCFMGGDISNNIFFLIMGYNLINRPFKKERIIKIWSKCFFYSILSWPIIFLFNKEMITIKNILAMFFPLVSSTWWFPSAYVIILLLSPLLNKLIHELDKKVCYKYVLIMMFIFAVLSCFVAWLNDKNSIYIMVIMYMVGGLIKKYKIRSKNKYYTCLCILGGLMLELVSAPILSKMNQNPLRLIWGPRKFFPVIISTFIFIRIMRKNIQIPKWAHFFPIAVFDVYLFHNGPLLGMIIEVLRLDKISHEKAYYPFFILMSVFFIFGLGSILAYIRMFLFDILRRSRIKIIICEKIKKIEKILDSFLINVFHKLFEYD